MRRRRVWRVAIATLAAGVIAGGATLAGAASKTVSMGDNFFDPKKVKVGKGDRVTWVNDGQSDHTVKFQGEKNKIVAPGEQTGKKFKKAGKFKYRCTLHPEMVGKVIVQG